MMGFNGFGNEVTKGIKPLFPRLWRYCFVLTGSSQRADDLAQSACLKALEKAEQFKKGTQLDCWIFRIAQRLWLNEIRADAVRQGGGISTIDDVDLYSQRDEPEFQRANQEILMSVFSLPEAQRIAVALVYVEGYSYQEAADILEIPTGTVMSRLSAARRTLSSKLYNMGHAL